MPSRTDNLAECAIQPKKSSKTTNSQVILVWHSHCMALNEQEPLERKMYTVLVVSAVATLCCSLYTIVLPAWDSYVANRSDSPNRDSATSARFEHVVRSSTYSTGK